MTQRVLAGVAASRLSLYLLTYLWVVRTQDGDLALWYVGLGLLALLACVAAGAGVAPSTTTATALVLTAVTTLAALLSVGLLLLPAVLALTVSLFSGESLPDRRPA